MSDMVSTTGIGLALMKTGLSPFFLVTDLFQMVYEGDQT